ncbi:hypothetical protein ACJJTC_018979 [Scirpophaga incertulas]
MGVIYLRRGVSKRTAWQPQHTSRRRYCGLRARLVSKERWKPIERRERCEGADCVRSSRHTMRHCCVARREINAQQKAAVSHNEADCLRYPLQRGAGPLPMQTPLFVYLEGSLFWQQLGGVMINM